MAVSPNLVVKVVASIFIGLTAFGWFLVVIGFGIRPDAALFRGTPQSYPYWIVSIIGPLTFITAAVHLFADKVADKVKIPHAAVVGRIAGAIAAFLSTFFLTGLGMILYVFGLTIRLGVIQASLGVGFAGSLLATLFWTIVIILWHFNNIGAKGDE